MGLLRVWLGLLRQARPGQERAEEEEPEILPDGEEGEVAEGEEESVEQVDSNEETPEEESSD